MPEKLTIWAVSDGKAGIENQVLGLAEEVARLSPADIVTKRVRYRPEFDRLPSFLKLFPDAMLAPDSDAIIPPWPDLWIAAGRATIPHAIRMRQRSGGKTFVIQLQDPRHDPRAFDLVIAPEHDHVSGDNVLQLIGSTNRITPEQIAQGYAGWEGRIASLTHPRVAVLVGGRSKAYDLTAARATAIAAEVRRAVLDNGGSLLLTVSRRTPEEARTVLIDSLKDLPGILWDGTGGNPYFAFLHAADHILVTEDSVNMATEAAVTGKPVQIIPLDRRSLGAETKFDDFHESLRARGIALPFDGALRGEPYEPLRETGRAARFVLDKWHEKSGMT